MNIVNASGIAVRDSELSPWSESLCYLALRPGGAHRDQIIDALWPEQTPEHARNRLSRAAADARAQLGETSLRRDVEQYQTLTGRGPASGDSPGLRNRRRPLSR